MVSKEWIKPKKGFIMEDTEKVAASGQENKPFRKWSSQANVFRQNANTPPQEDTCRTELLEMKNRYLYLNAEFDNYKKRISKEQASWTENAQDRILIDVLTVADDLDRAFAELKFRIFLRILHPIFRDFR